MNYRVLKQEAGNSVFEPERQKDVFSGDRARERAEEVAAAWVKERSGRRAEVCPILHTFWSSVEIHNDRPDSASS
jgi:hypothetical protein